MNKIIKELEKRIKYREVDFGKGYLNEYGKGYLAGLKGVLLLIKRENQNYEKEN